eukprot:Skav207586  [mRNA]  locus=scaffold2450:35622:36218:+ [translate_table: standard]
MSSEGSRTEDGLVDLTIQFQDLRITVHGPLSSSVDFVRRLSGPSDSGAATGSAAEEDSQSVWSVVGGSPEEGVSFEDTFPALPAVYHSLASNLAGTASRLSPVKRLERAWVAGCWAKAILERRCPPPSATPKLDLANRFYVVVRGPGITSPRLFSSYSAFQGAVGTPSSARVICHGFPSKTEISVYLAAVGESLPSEA